MAARQEPERATRKYNTTPRPVPAIAKFRSGANWSEMPDYSRLPDFALVGMSEVSVLTGMSKSALEKRIRDGVFAAPKYHGKDRVWSLGYVRRWCEQFAQSFEIGGAQ